MSDSDLYGERLRKYEDSVMIDVAAMFNDDDIIFKYGFMNPRTILRQARIAVLVRIISKSPPVLLDLIIAQSSFKKGWVTSLTHDLQWLLPSLEISGSLPTSISDWVDLITRDTKGFLKKTKAYCKTPFANIVSQWAVSPVLRTFAHPIDCMLCGRVSKSQQAHSVHMFREHGVKSDMRRYVPFIHCTVCLREFGQHET